MQKPTSYLNAQIINYLLSDSRVLTLLRARDSHAHILGVGINCSFYMVNRQDKSKSAYKVDFIYEVREQNLEQNDDVSVLVEVSEGNPPAFRILDIRAY